MADIVINLEVIDQNNIVLEVVNYDQVGPQGLSAYQIAIANETFIGTELEWAQSLAHITVGPVRPPTPIANQLHVLTPS